MPMYDFACLSCGVVFESIELIVDTVIPCQECGQPARRVLINAPKSGRPAFRPGLVMNDGSVIHGYDKDAPRRRKKKKK